MPSGRLGSDRRVSLEPSSKRCVVLYPSFFPVRRKARIIERAIFESANERKTERANGCKHWAAKMCFVSARSLLSIPPLSLFSRNSGIAFVPEECFVGALSLSLAPRSHLLPPARVLIIPTPSTAVDVESVGRSAKQRRGSEWNCGLRSCSVLPNRTIVDRVVTLRFAAMKADGRTDGSVILLPQPMAATNAAVQCNATRVKCRCSRRSQQIDCGTRLGRRRRRRRSNRRNQSVPLPKFREPLSLAPTLLGMLPRMVIVSHRAKRLAAH